MSGEVIVLVTTASGDSLKIANSLVEEKLAACVNILPGVKSVFTWEDKLCTEDEQLLIIKSRAELFSHLCLRIKELHSYEVPEIIQLPIEAGYGPYMQWLNASMRSLEDSSVESAF